MTYTAETHINLYKFNEFEPALSSTIQLISFLNQIQTREFYIIKANVQKKRRKDRKYTIQQCIGMHFGPNGMYSSRASKPFEHNEIYTLEPNFEGQTIDIILNVHHVKVQDLKVGDHKAYMNELGKCGLEEMRSEDQTHYKAVVEKEPTIDQDGLVWIDWGGILSSYNIGDMICIMNVIVPGG